jgi:hypothetical protein
MNIEWFRLRTWNGFRNNAFEELCCQLAHCENVHQGSRFTREGAPHAGIECGDLAKALLWNLP